MKFRIKKQPVTPPGRRRPAGSQQPRIAPFGYYSGRPQRPAAEQLERSKTARNAPLKVSRWHSLSFLQQRFGLIIVAVAVAVFLLNMLRLSPDVTVESLNSSATSYLVHDQKTYQSAASAYLDSSLFNKNKITVNTTAVVRQLRHDFPELTSVSIAIPVVSHRPVVYIRTSEPTFVLLASSGQSFVIDDTGKALATTATVRNLQDLHLPVVRDESGLSVQRGDIVLSSGAAVFISEVAHQLAAKNIGIASMRLPGASNELDVYPANSHYFVKFNLQNDSAVQQTGTYLAVIQKLQGEGESPVSYIDVRIDGRAYYK